MNKINNSIEQKTIDPESSESLQEYEDHLRNEATDEIVHLFRTYRLLYPGGTVFEWHEFSTVDLADVFVKVVDKLTVPTILYLLRRHFDQLPFFLSLFDKSAKIQAQPKTYLPFLCHNVNLLPIQWIAHHILRIPDVRYAYQLLTNAFSSCIQHSSSPLEENERKAVIWMKIKEIVPSISDETPQIAWIRMTSFRTAIRELLDFKLTIRLAEYMRLDKKEFVKRMLQSATSAEKASKLLKHQILPYCNSNSIDSSQLIISTLMKKDWDVKKKLQIVFDYIQPAMFRKRAIEAMTFKSDEDLIKIKDVAGTFGINFEPDPHNFVTNSGQENSPSRFMGRSSSIEFLQNECKMPARMSLEASRKSPSSLNFCKYNHFAASTSLSSVADGTPNNPVEYANKLSKYKVLGEIKPIYSLATYFDTVIAYDKFIDPSLKRQLFKKLIKKFGYDRLDEITNTMVLTPDFVVESICADEQFYNSGSRLNQSLHKYVSRSNCDFYYMYFNKAIDYMLQEGDNQNICEQLISSLELLIDYFDGRKLLPIFETYHLVTKIKEMKADIFYKVNILKRFRHGESIKGIAEILRNDQFNTTANEVYNSSIEISQEDFISGVKSEKIFEVVSAIVSLMKLDDSEIIKFLISAVSSISGRKYSLLQLVFELLKVRNINYETEINSLNVLYFSVNHQIDFHKLIDNPSETLKEALTIENIWELYPLITHFDLNHDEILLYFLVNKTDSPNLNDYDTFISKLRKKESLDPLLEHIAPRFSEYDKITFYQSLGCVEKKRYTQTTFNLRSFGLEEFITDEFMENPSRLICEIYCKMSLHEKLGERLHKLAKKITARYELSISKIHEHLINIWLNENETKALPNEDAIFLETTEMAASKEDQTNIQKSLFILRTWKPRDAAKWLIRFIYQGDSISYRARAKASTCLFNLTQPNVIASSYNGNFLNLIKLHKTIYYSSRFELFGIKTQLSDFEPDNIKKTIKNIMKNNDLLPGIFTGIFTIIIEHKIDDLKLIIQVLQKLSITRKRFLLQNFINFYNVFPQYKTNEHIKAMFIETISAPFSELIEKREYTKPFKSHHLSVIRDVFAVISIEPFKIDHFVIQGQQVTWETMISQLCSIGFAPLAAELGSLIIDEDVRSSVLYRILDNGNYDESLQFGFDHELIFNYIVEHSLEQATETMIDEHFIMFTAWLKINKKEDAILKVTDALMKQGRTMEVKRMNERFTHMNPK